MRLLLAVTALLCLLFSIGCDPGESLNFEEDKSNSNNTEQINSLSLPDFVRFTVTPTTEPEKYIVYWSWPKIIDNKKLRIRQEQILSVAEPSQRTFSHEVNHNQNLNYTFEILDENYKIERSFTKIVKVPKDLVIREGTSTFNENTKLVVERVFINKTPLVTNGHNIEIQTQELISDNGILETFPASTKAEKDISGRSGGEITIKAKSAMGRLRVMLRGEHGGDGSDGPAFTTRAADGSPPTAGGQRCTCDHFCIDLKSVNPHKLQSMNSSDVFAGESCHCEFFGNNGGKGTDGQPGLPGNKAADGGSTGKLSINVQDAREFDLQIEKIPGLAGNPGKGGPGQPGGVGGQRPHKHRKDSCFGGNGPNGAQGPQGPSGNPGDDGKIENACVYLVSEGKNDCF